MLSLRRIFIIINLILLQACGGGGGGGGATNITPTPPSPSNAVNSSTSSSAAISALSSTHTESSSSYINSSSSSSLSSSAPSSSALSSSSKSSLIATPIRFRSDFSLQCLSISETNNSVVQNDCNNNTAQWEILPIKGDLYRISSKTNGLCLSVENDDPSGTNLIQLPCDDTIKTRLWHFNLVTKISLVSDNTNLLSYELKNSASFLCTDIVGKTHASGAQLSQASCTRATNQHWRALGTIPDTADRIDLNLLVITKVASKIPGMPERTTTKEVREKQRFWSEVAFPKFFHDYTNGRVKLNVYYYESPYLLKSFVDGNAVVPADIPEDLDLIVNPGWFDGVFIHHAAPVGGLITYSGTINGFTSAFSSTPINDQSYYFYAYDLAELTTMTHEYLHQLEYYFYIVPERRKLTDRCAPINFSMLDCGANEPQGGNYSEETDGLGPSWMAFYRDFLNGYLWNGKGGLGDEAWSTNHKPREYNSTTVSGGPFAPFANQSTCLNLTSQSGKYVRDIYPTNNFATINNKNQSENWTSEGFAFDGIDDYFRISNLIGDDFTISMWIKSSQSFPSGSTEGISLVYSGADDGNGFELRGVYNAFDADGIEFLVGNNTILRSSSDVTNNTWVHIAVSRNQSTGIATLYVNGKKEAEGNAGFQRLNKNPLIKIGSAFQYPKIGQSNLHNDHFKGEMAGLCILNNTLNELDIKNIVQAGKPQSITMTAGKQVYLSDMQLSSGITGWATIGIDKALTGNPIIIDGKTYKKGLGVHAPSKLVYHLDKKASRFISDIGIDDEAKSHIASSEFQVYGDNVLLYRSGDKIDTDKAETIILDISSVDELTLITTIGDNGSNFADATDWGDARIILK